MATSTQELKGYFQQHPERKRSNEPIAPGGPLRKPRLKARASRVWDLYAPLCYEMKTLQHGDEAEFSTWCYLRAEYEADPESFTASKLTQMRAYANAFGICGASSRAKLAVTQRDEDAEYDFYTKTVH